MFDLYTERARRLIFFARYEASQLGRGTIDTEHLLLGLIREGKGLTARLFAKKDLSTEQIRRAVEGRSSQPLDVSTSVEIPFSPESRRVLGYAAQEATSLRQNYIGTEHVLLGLLREKSGLAAAILGEKGMHVVPTRQEIVALLAEAPVEPGAPTVTLDEIENPETEPPPIELNDVDRKFLRSLKITVDVE